MITFGQIKAFVKTTTARLALSYLAIIMLMSLGFSFVFYDASSHELGRQLPQPSNFRVQQSDRNSNRGIDIDDFLQERIAEGRQALLARLIVLNIMALGLGSTLSYYLARRTLLPIELNMEAQAQFVSDASHELRTPLTALQATNEVALRRPKISTAEAKDILKNNIEEVVKLQLLTNGLLRLAKQDNEPIALTPVSLQEVASDAMNNVIGMALAKKIAIDDKVPAVLVRGDRVGLSQAVVILLDNAIKYSQPGGTIKLEGGKDGKRGFIRVIDTGNGIAAEDLPNIFDRFYRADPSRNKQHVAGYGIGLALAKKIVDQHHGVIIAASVPGHGATFTLTVPLD